MVVEDRIKQFERTGGSGVQTSDNIGKVLNSTGNRGISNGSMSQTGTTRKITTVNVNIGYLRTILGLLKLVQLVLGAACVGLVGYYMDHRNSHYTISPKTELFFFVVAVAFLIGTFCLFTSCLVSLPTAEIIPKTIYEVTYHGLAFIMYLAAGLTLIIEVNYYKNEYGRIYGPFLAASVMGLVMAVLYLLSTIFAYKKIKVNN